MHDGGVHKTYIPTNKNKSATIFLSNFHWILGFACPCPHETIGFLTFGIKMTPLTFHNIMLNIFSLVWQLFTIGFFILYIKIFTFCIFFVFLIFLDSKEFHPSCPNEIQLVYYFHYQYPNGQEFLMSQVVIFIFCIHMGNVH